MIFVWTVGLRLGLTITDMTAITAAADNHEGRNTIIRAELLRACGLTSQPLNEKEKLKP